MKEELEIIKIEKPKNTEKIRDSIYLSGISLFIILSDRFIILLLEI